MPPSLRFFQAASSARHRWSCSATMNNHCHPRRLASNTTNDSSNSKKKHRNNQFLIPGFQPTAITGDNIGFYSGSTFFEGVPPAPLPILNLAAILSPGQYCKKSSWSTSHHRHKGTKSGIDAAHRLVLARRELMRVIREELGMLPTADNTEDYNQSDERSTRKIYAITGHGVPSSLLRHLTEAARSWLHPHYPSSTFIARTNHGEEYPPITHNQNQKQQQQQQQQQPSSVKIEFRNIPNSTLLDQNQITTTNIHGNMTTLASLPKEWEHDLEMYMVTMDRMGSRLASLSFPTIGSSSCGYESDQINNNDDETSGSGSVLIPSNLAKWRVTIMKGEALPMSLLPGDNELAVVKSSSGRGSGVRNGRHHYGEGTGSMPKLTIEWTRRKSKHCWILVLRLQADHGAAEHNNLSNDNEKMQKNGDPISLVFEGEYVSP